MTAIKTRQSDIVRVLAFSDIIKWEELRLVIDTVKPDIIVLAGDLSWEGFATFYYPRDLPFEVQRRIHAEKFYRFLKYAGEKAAVLVVKGDHDEEGYYSSEKIDEIAGCKEISGKFLEVKGLGFLGFGFRHAHSPKVIRNMINQFNRKVDVVVMHGENIRYISLLKPHAIIKGGGGGIGICLVNDIISVYIGPNVYAVIDFRRRKAYQIRLFRFSGESLTESHLPYRRYKWMKRY